GGFRSVFRAGHAFGVGADERQPGGERTRLAGTGDLPAAEWSGGAGGLQLWSVFGGLYRSAIGSSGGAAPHDGARQTHGRRNGAGWNRSALGVETEPGRPPKPSRIVRPSLRRGPADRAPGPAQQWKSGVSAGSVHHPDGP